METTTSNNALQAQVAARLAELGYFIESFNDEKKAHQAVEGDDSPAVYCGTYGKYNGSCGSDPLFGQWIDLTTFSDYDEFYDYCCALHADEKDPELMFQDFANFPSEFFEECMGEDEFDKIQQYIQLCENYRQEAVDAYISLTCGDDLDGFAQAYQGEWDSEADFARQYIDDVYDLDRMPEMIVDNIDYDGVADDLFCGGYEMEDGFVFYRC